MSDSNEGNELGDRIRDLCEEVERIYEAGGRYPKITVHRQWSKPHTEILR